MKYILLFIVINYFNLSFGQCKYSAIQYDNTARKGIIKSYPITLDVFETPMNGRIILAILIRSGNQYYIDLEITSDSSSQDLTPICLDYGSRLGFLLKNNTTLSIPHIDSKVCGVKTFESETGYTTASNYGLFLLTQDAFDKLLTSEIIMMKIIDKDYNKKFVIKDELEEFIDGETKLSNPGRFFIDNIDCMVNPQFE